MSISSCESASLFVSTEFMTRFSSVLVLGSPVLRTEVSWWGFIAGSHCLQLSPLPLPPRCCPQSSSSGVCPVSGSSAAGAPQRCGREQEEVALRRWQVRLPFHPVCYKAGNRQQRARANCSRCRQPQTAGKKFARALWVAWCSVEIRPCSHLLSVKYNWRYDT